LVARRGAGQGLAGRGTTRHSAAGAARHGEGSAGLGVARRVSQALYAHMLRAFTDVPREPVACLLYTGEGFVTVHAHPERVPAPAPAPVTRLAGLPPRRYCDQGHDPVEWSGRRLHCWFCGARGIRGSTPPFAVPSLSEQLSRPDGLVR